MSDKSSTHEQESTQCSEMTTENGTKDRVFLRFIENKDINWCAVLKGIVSIL
jgi:hypothetical protein